MHAIASPFLTARWLNLAVLNFEIDPAVLEPFLPEGTEIDYWQGRALVSVVGFQFYDTRVWNVSVPFHRNFAEVNLRFYVRREVDGGRRRGVCFIKELAPRRAIAWTARLLFGENYATVPVRHAIELPTNGDGGPRRSAYAWRHRGRDFRMEATARGHGSAAAAGSEAEFVLEQYWGYSGRPGRETIEYRVAHRPWTVWPAASARLVGDVSTLYGEPFAAALAAPPASAFLVDGSAIELFWGVRLGAARPSASFQRG
ncbi:MAG: YqjF family protein [Pirellulales bacterium]